MVSQTLNNACCFKNFALFLIISDQCGKSLTTISYPSLWVVNILKESK